jgi:hypothetical protein
MSPPQKSRRPLFPVSFPTIHGKLNTSTCTLAIDLCFSSTEGIRQLVKTPLNVRFIDCEFYLGPQDDTDCPFRPVQFYLADGNGKDIVPLILYDTGLLKDELLIETYRLVLL